MNRLTSLTLTALLLAPLAALHAAAAPAAPPRPAPLTPAAPATPRINGPSVFGVRPGSPFLYSIPATGERPMTFAVEGLRDLWRQKDLGTFEGGFPADIPAHGVILLKIASDRTSQPAHN